MIIVVADTGPINYLILIDAIDVVPRIYDQLVLPQAVFSELTHQRAPAPVRNWASALPVWVRVSRPISGRDFPRLDPGEAEAISLAVELQPACLLLDEAEARHEALKLGLPVSGTIGLLEQASQRGLVRIHEMIERLLRTSFRIDKALIRQILLRNPTEEPQD